MKKVLSVLLVVLMIAALSVNVFAKEATYLYEADKSVEQANEELTITPDELKDYEGFGDMVYVAEATFETYGNDKLFTANPFRFTKATAGNTLVFYYYVENTGNQTLFIRRNNSTFDVLPATPGYHVYSITTDIDVTSVNVYLKNESNVAGTIKVYIGSVVVREGAVDVSNFITYSAQDLWDLGILSDQAQLVDFENEKAITILIDEGYERFINTIRTLINYDEADAKAHASIWMKFFWTKEANSPVPGGALFIHNAGGFNAIAYAGEESKWLIREIPSLNYLTSEYQGNGYFNLHDQGAMSTIYIRSLTVGYMGDNFEGTINGADLIETGEVVGRYEVVASLDGNDLMNGRINCFDAHSEAATIEDKPAKKVTIDSTYHRWFNYVEDYMDWPAADAQENYRVYVTFYQDKDANIYIHNAGGFSLISTTAGWHTCYIPKAHYLADGTAAGQYFNFHDQGAGAVLYVTNVTFVKFSEEKTAARFPGLDDKENVWDGNASIGLAFIRQALSSSHAKEITFNYMVVDDGQAVNNGALCFWNNNDFSPQMPITNGIYSIKAEKEYDADGCWRSRFHHGSKTYFIDLYVNDITITNPGGKAATLETVEALDVLTEKAFGADGGSIACNFAADKVFAITVDYRVYTTVETGATMTIGNKTVNLKKADGFYSASVGLTGGATSIDFVVPEGAVIAIDAIYYTEAAEEYTALASTVENLATEITLDSTICTNATYAINDLTKVLEVELGDDYVVLSVELEEDGFVAAESALALDAFAAGSLTAYVEIYQISTDLTYSTTLTFAIDEAAPTASMPTGDIIMIVGIVALVSMLALAGVVITKKKLLNK